MVNLKSLYKKNKIYFLFFSVIIITTVFKFIYVFALTDYTNYLVSDMGGYWQRALQRYHGDFYNINQWVIWPPFSHIVLAGVFKVTEFFGVIQHSLEIVLSINILLSSLSVFYLFHLTLKLTQNDKIAFFASTLYAVTYHTIYFNAFILSENAAVPLVMAAIYFLFLDKKRYYILSGLLLALATGIRPGYGLFGLPFALYALIAGSKNLKSDWKQTLFFKGIIKAGVFSISFFLIIFFVFSEVKNISGGRVTGLAASSGINYYFSFTKKYEISSSFNEYYYVIIPPGTVRNPENGKLVTNEPIFNAGYFKKLANNYIKENPEVIFTKFKDIWELYFGVLFPSFTTAKGFGFFTGLFRVIFFLLTLLTIFSLFTRPRERTNHKNYLFLVSIIFLSLLTCYLFNSEHRYVYGFIFAVYPLAFDMIFELRKDFGKYARRMAIFVSILSIPFIGIKSASVIRKWNMTENFAVEIKEYGNTEKVNTFEIDRVNFPFRKQLTHGTLGKTRAKDRFEMMITGEFDLLQSGYVEFYIYCEEGAMLVIDDDNIIFREERDDEKELKNEVFLNSGRHSFKIRYQHLSEDAGIKAMYFPLSFKGEKYFFGEGSEYVRF